MFKSTTRALVAIHAERTGSGTMKRALEESGGCSMLLGWHAASSNPADYEGCRVVSVHRSPFRRAVSQYLWHQGGKQSITGLGKPPKKGRTFARWLKRRAEAVDAIRAGRLGDKIPQTLPIFDLLRAWEVPAEVVERLEWIPHVELPEWIRSELGVEPGHVHQQPYSKPWHAFYDAKLEMLVRRIAGEEFDAFGYPNTVDAEREAGG